MKSLFKPDKPQTPAEPTLYSARYDLTGVVSKATQSSKQDGYYVNVMIPRPNAWKGGSQYDSIQIFVKCSIFKAPNEKDIVHSTGTITSFWDAPTKTIRHRFTAETCEVIGKEN